MRVTIVPADNQVIVDGRPTLVDLSELRSRNIHAIQWYDNWGEIEYKSVWLENEHRHHREPNLHITNLSELQVHIDKWIERREIEKRAEQVTMAESQRLLEQQNQRLLEQQNEISKIEQLNLGSKE